uniref:Uncharacterized protein n=1 Tax=Petromyzon marinus TaxID=7757 RepID=S4R4T0_PETMA
WRPPAPAPRSGAGTSPSAAAPPPPLPPPPPCPRKFPPQSAAAKPLAAGAVTLNPAQLKTDEVV